MAKKTADQKAKAAKADPKAKVEAAPEAEKPKKKGKVAPDIIVVPKYVTKEIAGLAFWTPGLKPFKGVQAWVDAKCPNGVYIYDTLDNLATCGIPVHDAMWVNGLASRIKVRKPAKVQVNIAYAIPSKLPEIRTTVESIKDSDTKAHHQMQYV